MLKKNLLKKIILSMLICY